MSLFFLILTCVTFLLSHFFAKRIQPNTPTSFDWTKRFHGDLESFTKKIYNLIDHNPQWLLLEKTKHRLVISESPGLFQFGCFYHIHCQETQEGLVVKVQTQSKLIGPFRFNSKLGNQFFKGKEFENVS